MMKKSCKSESYSGCGIPFHSFPTKQEMKQRWLAVLPVPPINITKNSVVCSLHFKSENLYEANSRKMLMSNAVPSILNNLNFSSFTAFIDRRGLKYASRFAFEINNYGVCHMFVGSGATFADILYDKNGVYIYILFDDRTKDWFPTGWFLLTAMPFYLYFTLSLGPRLMRDLKPFKLRSIMFVYNLFQIFICVYMLTLALKGGWFTGYNILCQPLDRTENPQSRTMLNAVWWYTMVKIIDLMDTGFFILRKKYRQVTFLHVLHHFGMPIAASIMLKYHPNGHGTLIGVLNCIVHIVMYTYYLIAGLGPKYKKILWWKKYLTVMQIVQFGIIFIHNLIALTNSSCNYPKWLSALTCFHATHFMFMFSQFYYYNYIKKSDENTVRNSNGSAKVLNSKSKVQ